MMPVGLNSQESMWQNMVLKEKYVVHKITGQVEGIETLDENPLPQGEFFVLRKQDLLAVHALWAYIGVVRVAATLKFGSNLQVDLQNLADELFDLAVEWDETTINKKLPD